MKLYWKVKREGKWHWIPAEVGTMTVADWWTVLSPGGSGISCQCSACRQEEEE